MHWMPKFTAHCRRASEKVGRRRVGGDDDDKVEELISKQLRM